jgi:hypothetical protein
MGQGKAEEVTTAAENNGKTDHAGDYFRERQADGRACLEAALDYLARGWAALAICTPDHVGVGPTHGKQCNHPGKAPWGPWKDFQTQLPAEEELRRKWKDNPQLNVGMTLGGITGLIGLDVDEDGGEELLRRLSKGDLPPTLEFSSGKGRRLLYRVPPGVRLKPTPKPGGEEVESGELRLLGLGSQTVMPPSRHKDSGRCYAWKPGHGPGEMEPALAPAWVVDLMRDDAHGRKGKHSHQRAHPLGDGEPIHEKYRNSTLTSLAGTMRRRGMTEEEIAAALLVVNANRCKPPLEEGEVRGIARSVARYEPFRGTATGDGAGQEAKDIILAYFRRIYQPVFKRGEALYSSSLGREVRRAEACFGASTELIDALAHATNAPRLQGDVINHAALPNLFKTWSRTAWADLLKDLPEEESGDEIVDPAAEDFRALVSVALHRPVKLGQVYERVRGKEIEMETQAENRSLIDWCRLWAKPGGWAQVRSYLLWCRLEATEEGARLRVALRPELFRQVGGTDLAGLTQRRFAKLAEMYNVGLGQECRPGGRTRAVELTEEFLADLLDRPAMTNDASASGAHTRENGFVPSSEEDLPC